MLLADQLNIKLETARSIVHIWMIEDRVNRLQRGGVRNVKMIEEMQRVMLGIISERPFSTFADINREMQNRLPLAPRVTDTTIARHPEGQLITVKITGKDSDVLGQQRETNQRILRNASNMQCSLQTSASMITSYNIYTSVL